MIRTRRNHLWALAALVLIQATPGRAGFQQVIDGSDPQLHQASLAELLTSPLGDEVPFMLGGVCRLDADNGSWLIATRAADPFLLLTAGSQSPFVTVESELGPPLYYSGCAVGDIDGDRDPDVVMLACEHGVELYRSTVNASGLSFNHSLIAGSPTSALTSPILGDYDNDGDLDLVVLQWRSAGGIRLFENNGKGGFTDKTSLRQLDGVLSYGFSGGFADINGDGWLDLLIVADFGNSKVLLNHEGDWFEDVTAAWNAGTDENGMGSAIGDIDGDGDLDWFVTSIYDPFDTCSQFDCNWGITGNRLYINEGGTHFRDATDEYGVRDGGWGWGASFLDYDNDGDLDLAMTNGIDFPDSPLDGGFVADKTRLWRNDGTPPMVEVSESVGFVDDGPGKGISVFDSDSDGDLDVFIVNTADDPAFFLNDADGTNAWLRVKLHGIESNAQGYGARVYVMPTESGPMQFREVNANNNYMSQNESTAHFGLGLHDGPVATVRVNWPVSGIETILHEVPTRRVITIHERIMGDLTDDGMIDLYDFAGWTNCQSDAASPNPACAAGDFNADGALDLIDWSVLAALLK